MMQNLLYLSSVTTVFQAFCCLVRWLLNYLNNVQTEMGVASWLVEVDLCPLNELFHPFLSNWIESLDKQKALSAASLKQKLSVKVHSQFTLH
jgi:hypothetical protein